ncbi:GIY-YIG nuclease family protein [Candidatus Pacearchaeota archaeon]|jgi:putative endonuclease|nr:GIY-YIG nuclease family protein [Candidatus Pacearchaeota archaeon]
MTDNPDYRKKQWVVYLVRCTDNSLYCGITNDLTNRIRAHNTGTGAKYTRGRGPVELVCATRPMSHFEAARLECQVKTAVDQQHKINLINQYEVQ